MFVCLCVCGGSGGRVLKWQLSNSEAVPSKPPKSRACLDFVLFNGVQLALVAVRRMCLCFSVIKERTDTFCNVEHRSNEIKTI